MRPLLVVFDQPLPSDLPDLVEVLEQISTEHLITERPVEPLDERILVRLARLDVLDLDIVLLAASLPCIGLLKSIQNHGVR